MLTYSKCGYEEKILTYPVLIQGGAHVSAWVVHITKKFFQEPIFETIFGTNLS